MRPIIAIPTSTVAVTAMETAIVEKAFVNMEYIESITRAGGAPMLVPCTDNESDIDALLQFADGVLLPGGDDVDPSYYGEDPHVLTGILRPDIDKFLFAFIALAEKRKLPMFGVCKGLQALNVYFGGSLYQDLSLHPNEVIAHTQRYSRAYLTHSIQITEDSLIHRLMGDTTVAVNSMHHQSLKKVADGFVITATASDGVIEAFEHTDGRIFAVQWHPEALTEKIPQQHALFQHLIALATDYNAQRRV